MESSGVKKMERQIERAKKKEEDPSFILDDITREIVKRLPLRSVLRLCTVSSSWLAMIFQFNYAQSHNPANFLFTSMRTLESSELYRWFHWSSQGEVLMDNGELLDTLSWCLGRLVILVNRITPFPKEARPPLSTHELIKFNGKLALAPYPVLHGNFDVFVLDDFNKHTWSKQSFDIPGWGNLVHWRLDKVDMDEHYHCKGTVPTGELIFAPDRLIRGAVDLLSFDMEDEVLSIVKIEGVASEDDDYLVETFLNFIEEPLLLPGGTKDFYRKKGNMSSRRE